MFRGLFFISSYGKCLQNLLRLFLFEQMILLFGTFFVFIVISWLIVPIISEVSQKRCFEEANMIKIAGVNKKIIVGIKMDISHIFKEAVISCYCC